MNGISRNALPVIASLALALGFSAMAADEARSSDDEGYFLDWSQKWQLLSDGSISDSQGNVYNVKVAPGYVPMWSMATKHWSGAGDSFAQYGEGHTYSNIGDVSWRVLRSSSDDILWSWGLKGSYLCWGKYMNAASQSVSRRSFGWFLAYPAGIGLASLESLGRFSVGVPAGLCGDALGVSVVPVSMFVWPFGKGTGESLVPGTVVPLMGVSWNTAGTPFLAATGQKPAPSRVDGLFVTMVPKPMDPAKVEELLAAVKSLKPLVDEARKKDDAVKAEAQAGCKRIYDDVQKKLAAQNSEARAKLKAAIEANPQAKSQLLELYAAKKLDRSAVSAEDLKKHGLKESDFREVLGALTAPGSGYVSNWDLIKSCKQPQAEKVEPLLKELGK